MRKLNWDLLQLQKGSRDGSHGTRRERSYALAQNSYWRVQGLAG